MKRIFRWCFDLIMILLFVLMFNKRAISMSFHEIGGLVLAAIIVVHICLNYRYVINVTKRLFSKQIPAKTRIGYFVNLILLVVFALIIISGVFMSKVVFHIQGGNGWRNVHYTSSAIALIFMGVHVGLHWGFIKGVFKKIVRIPHKVSRPIAYIMMVALLVVGGYSIATSSFTRWITMPFTTQQQGMNGHNGENPFADGKNFNNGDGQWQGRGEGRGQGMGQGRGEGKGEGMGRGNGYGKGMGEQSGQNFQIGTVFSVITTFLSIISLFAILTYWIQQLVIYLKRRKNTPALTADIINE